MPTIAATPAPTSEENPVPDDGVEPPGNQSNSRIFITNEEESLQRRLKLVNVQEIVIDDEKVPFQAAQPTPVPAAEEVENQASPEVLITHDEESLKSRFIFPNVVLAIEPIYGQEYVDQNLK